MRLLVLISFVFVAACGPVLPGKSGPRERSSPEEELLDAAFIALKKKDWNAFSELTVTTADFDIQTLKQSPLMERQSYAGGVLRPEERLRIKEQFEIAAGGGEGMIDFESAEFVSVGKAIDRGMVESIGGELIPFTSYSIKIEVDGETVDTRDLRPVFIVVKWQGRPRILALDVVDYSTYPAADPDMPLDAPGESPVNAPVDTYDAPPAYDDGSPTFENE
jgi:hypothetical protein